MKRKYYYAAAYFVPVCAANVTSTEDKPKEPEYVWRVECELHKTKLSNHHMESRTFRSKDDALNYMRKQYAHILQGFITMRDGCADYHSFMHYWDCAIQVKDGNETIGLWTANLYKEELN